MRLVFFFLFVSTLAHAKCVQIFYDSAPESPKPYTFGRTHVLFLQNLMGHFPHIQQIIRPIETYRKGMMEDCDSNIYLGTYYFDRFDTEEGDAFRIPRDFLADYLSTKKRVAWLGYNVWQLGEAALDNLWNVKFRGLSTLDRDIPDADGLPGFFKFYEYRGETFFKFGEWEKTEKPVSEDERNFLAAFEISRFTLVRHRDDSKVLSWARHSVTGERTPYILRNENRFYVGDSPFSFMTEEDRYLIFCDLLFDILNEPPRHTGKRPAFFRLEDVHPVVPAWQVEEMARMLHRNNVNFAVSLIPVFADPREVLAATLSERSVPLTQAPEMVAALQLAKQKGGSFLLHGFTHQYGKFANPFNGMSGDDFEFWDRVRNRPIREDSPDFVFNRLETALSLIEDANHLYGSDIRVSGWLTPHYQASPLDNILFGKLFTWTVGRDIYFPYQVNRIPTLDKQFRMDVAGTLGAKVRAPQFTDLHVRYESESLPNGQLFPFEIYGDIYGQRKIPENVGNVQPYKNEQVHRTQSVEELISILKRNRVLRDTWGSFFVHPFRLNERFDDGVGEFPGDTKEIERLVQAAQDFGYEFIDLQTWVRSTPDTIRPEPIEFFMKSQEVLK